jgi:hypothetical protein
MVICHKIEAEGDEYGYVIKMKRKEMNVVMCHKNEAEGNEYGYLS